MYRVTDRLHVQNRQYNNIFILCYCMENFFDLEADFQVYRRNLPHRRQAGVTYFVTFHLALNTPLTNAHLLAQDALPPLRLSMSLLSKMARTMIRPVTVIW
jgi:hypothetical protein